MWRESARTWKKLQKLHEWQAATVDLLRWYIRRGKRRPLLVAPTGSGKTTMACHVMLAAVAKGSRCQFVAHRRELVDQCSARLDEHSVPHGVLMADHWRRYPQLPVQVCSIQTMLRRNYSPSDLLIIDEAHRSVSKGYREVISRHTGVLIGLTATPVRLDGRGLGELYDCIVEAPSTRELTQMGFLVPVRVFAPSCPNLDGVRVARGDYVREDLAHVMDQPRLVGDVLEHWTRLAGDRSTIGFAVDVHHSMSMRDRFLAAGIRAEHVDGDTPRKERQAIISRMRDGASQVLWNCEVGTEGLDIPRLSCAIKARPTESLGLSLQMDGRILRLFPGKTDAIILDHAGCAHRHGLPTDEREWSLDGKEKRKKSAVSEDIDPIRTCVFCYLIYDAKFPRCPECGTVPEKKERKSDTTEAAGNLVEINGRKVKLARDPRHAFLQRVAAEMGFKPGWVYHSMQGVRRGWEPKLPEGYGQEWESLRSHRKNRVSRRSSQTSLSA